MDWIVYLFFVVIIMVGSFIFYLVKIKKGGPKNRYADLIKTGKVVTVNLDDCHVVNGYEYIAYDQTWMASQKEMLDALGPAARESAATANQTLQIVYQHTDDKGMPKLFVSPVINLDEIMLKYKMMTAKTTNIYIDRNNTDNYYFDIDFCYR